MSEMIYKDTAEGFELLKRFVRWTCHTPGASRSFLKVTESGTPVIFNDNKPDIYVNNGMSIKRQTDGFVSVVSSAQENALPT